MRRKEMNDRGFTLIEVVVSLAILGVGILALSQLFWFSAGAGTDSFYRTRAHVQAIDLSERFWLDLTDPDATVADWQNEHDDSMPGWSGEVEVEDLSDPNLFTVSIGWSGSSTHAAGTATYMVRTPTVDAP